MRTVLLVVTAQVEVRVLFHLDPTPLLDILKLSHVRRKPCAISTGIPMSHVMLDKTSIQAQMRV